MIRQFWLTNSDNTTFSLNGNNIANTLSFLHEPNGLGYSVNINTVKLGNTDVILNETYNLGSISGDLIFFGKPQYVYQQYQSFLSFLSKKPITMHYQPPNASDSYNCLVRVVSVEKSEINHDNKGLHCPIQFYRQSMWYNDNPNELDAYNRVEVGKSYPLDRPYSYGAISLENIPLSNSGMTDASLKIEVYGSCTNPEWALYDIESNQYGACKILGTYDYVRVDSGDLTEEIYLERSGASIPNAINYQDLTVGNPQQTYVTFLRLRSGTSRLAFNLGENFNGHAHITWSNAYVSV